MWAALQQHFWVCVVVSALVVAAQSTTEVPSFITRGKCKTTSPVSPFEPHKFTGRWYLTGGIRNTNPDDKCTTQDYAVTGKGFNVVTRGVDVDDNPTFEDNAIAMEDKTVARMLVNQRGRDVNLEVIATDYTSYACLSSCSLVTGGLHRAIFAWILARSSAEDSTVIATCQQALHSAGVPVGKLKSTYHGTNCTYL